MNYYTVELDYFATGEGRTLMALICRAENELGALNSFGQTFHPYYAQSATVTEGIALDSKIVSTLFSVPALNQLCAHAKKGASVLLYSSFSFNYS